MANSGWEHLYDNVRLHVGDYLTNTSREPGHCRVCTGPIDAGWDYCAPCNARRRDGDSYIDAVVCLAYGGHTPQSKRLLYGYKDPWHVSPEYAAAGFANREELFVFEMLFCALANHRPCLEAHGGAFQAASFVPSTKSAAPTRLGTIAGHLATLTSLPLADLVFAGTPGSNTRRVDESMYVLTDAPNIAGKHMLLIDDTWVSGSHAQSVAGALKRQGASRVTALTAGRWLDRTWPPSLPYFDNATKLRYEPELCPATGGVCPGNSAGA